MMKWFPTDWLKSDKQRCEEAMSGQVSAPPGSGLGISGGLLGLPEYQNAQNTLNHSMSQQIHDMAKQQAQQAQQKFAGQQFSGQDRPANMRTTWKVDIEKIENGFIVAVYDNTTGMTRQFIAADMPAILEQISVGMVLAKLEA